MGVLIPDNLSHGTWAFLDFEGPRHPCFHCAHPVGEGDVIYWMGATGSGVTLSDTATEETRAVFEALQRRSGMTAAGHIFLHPKCVPSFCIKLLVDWERTAGLRESHYMPNMPEADE